MTPLFVAVAIGEASSASGPCAASDRNPIQVEKPRRGSMRIQELCLLPLDFSTFK